MIKLYGFLIKNYFYFMNKGVSFLKKGLVRLLIMGSIIGSICIGNIAYAKTIVYPKTNHSATEMYQKGTDFLGGNPGRKGNSGKFGKSGNLGVAGIKGNPGKKGNDGKGRFIITY